MSTTPIKQHYVLFSPLGENLAGFFAPIFCLLFCSDSFCSDSFCSDSFMIVPKRRAEAKGGSEGRKRRAEAKSNKC